MRLPGKHRPLCQFPQVIDRSVVKFCDMKAEVLGFEPRLTDPESVVLPLHYTSMVGGLGAGVAWMPAPFSLV